MDHMAYIGLSMLAIGINLTLLIISVTVLDAFSNEIPVVARINGFIRPLVCDLLGWHNGNLGMRTHDGCSIHAHCSRCGKEVMQDSQGNWF